MRDPVAGVVVACLMFACSAPGSAQTPKPGMVLLSQLQAGGHVLFFRHMHADVGEDQLADNEYWRDCKKQRNLNERGKATAHSVGLLMRGLSIPVSAVRSGELCRARQTAEILAIGTVALSPSLNDYNTWKAQRRDPEKLVEAYRTELSTAPPKGTNTVLVSHAQRGRFAAHPVLDLIEMGTVAVFRPHADGTFELVATLRPTDWALLGFSELPIQ